MQLYSDYSILDRNLKDLGSDNASIQYDAAEAIKDHVEVAARELSLLRFANFENELYQNLFLYVHSGEHVREKLGGILAMRALLSCTSANAEQRVITFANTLSNCLKVNTDYSIIELVAVTLGQMAKASAVSQVNFVESELNQGKYTLPSLSLFPLHYLS